MTTNNNLTKDINMIFMCTYQLDRDKQAETQAFFANMTDEQNVLFLTWVLF